MRREKKIVSGVRVEIPQEWVTKCILFVDPCYKTNKECYAQSEQTDEDTCILQNCRAKLAETAVHLAFDTTTSPDFKIYEGRRKSWDPDLFLGDYRIHVKSTSHDFSPPSWMFQLGGRTGRMDDLLISSTDFDLVSPVLVNIKSRPVTAYILGMFCFDDVIDILSEPRLPRYITEKVVFYLDDLLPLPIDFWRIEPIGRYTKSSFTF